MEPKQNKIFKFIRKTKKIIQKEKFFYFSKLHCLLENKTDTNYKILNKQIRTMGMIDILIKTESLLKGHFELSSGLHSNQYFQCAKLLQYPEHAEKVGKRIAELFNPNNIDIVLGPAIGGLIIGYETARALGKRSIFTERKDGTMSLRRGFNINKGDKILIVEDVITTAKTTKETIEIIKEYGGKIAGIGCIVDRSKGETGLDIKSLIQIDPEIFTKEKCPMCKAGQSIEKPGSRTNSSV